MAKNKSETLEPEAATTILGPEMPLMEMSKLYDEFRSQCLEIKPGTPDEIVKFSEFLSKRVGGPQPAILPLAGNVDAITYSTDPEQKPSGVNITISGTMAMNTMGVTCRLLFEDDMGNVQSATITVNLANMGTTTATWQTAGFSLPYNNWRYLLTAQFNHVNPPSSSGKDHFLFTGTPT